MGHQYIHDENTSGSLPVGMEHLVNFFGRFHPLLVHLPIGSIILAFLFDALGLIRRYRRLQLAVQPSLLFGALSALFSVITGYCLSLEGGYDQSTLTLHQYAGILTTVISFLLVYLRINRSVLNFERRKRKPVRFFLFIPLVALLTLTGHWGGSLTHGDEFITEFSFSSAEERIDPITKVQALSNPDSAILYAAVIQPILESKCYSCHSSAKQKGDLRLDEERLILQGGKNGLVIHKGLADSSSLFSRMMLPLEHEDHMPPNEKPQPSSAEVDLLRLWINEGARFDQKVSELRDPRKAIQLVNLLVEGTQDKSWMPKDEVASADAKALQQLKEVGAVVIPAGQNTNYIHINFTNNRNLSIKDIEPLKAVQQQVVSLRFSYCTLEEADLAFLKDFDNLTWLYLDHTNVSDISFQSIETLPALKYLNVVFTEVSGKSITPARFPELQHLFVFQSNIRKADVAAIMLALPALKIDTGGVALPKLASDTIIYKKNS